MNTSFNPSLSGLPSTSGLSGFTGLSALGSASNALFSPIIGFKNGISQQQQQPPQLLMSNSSKISKPSSQKKQLLNPSLRHLDLESIYEDNDNQGNDDNDDHNNAQNSGHHDDDVVGVVDRGISNSNSTDVTSLVNSDLITLPSSIKIENHN